MATWSSMWWHGSAESVDHDLEIVAAMPAGSVLCYAQIEAKFSLASNGIANTAGDFEEPIQMGLALAAVAAGSGAPNFDSIGNSDDAIIWSGETSFPGRIIWAPSTAEGFTYPTYLSTYTWRGARHFKASMDWWLVAENEVGNSTDASAFVRIGFW
jgi:hypothetical protein